MISVTDEEFNIRAAETLGKLHDQFKTTGYDGHALEVLLVRLLFCLFAEDTTIFDKQQFQNLSFACMSEPPRTSIS